jgi:hypothetical protein
MAQLLRPSECSVLIVDALNSQDSEFTVIANRDRVLEAASVCGIPSFVALYLHDPTTGEPKNLSDSARYYSFPAIGVLWQDSYHTEYFASASFHTIGAKNLALIAKLRPL